MSTDSSTDGSRENIARLESTHPQIRVELQPKNVGAGGALHHGFQQSCGNFGITQDANFEYDVAVHLILLESLMEGKGEVVYGARFLGLGQPCPVLLALYKIGFDVCSRANKIVIFCEMELAIKPSAVG